MTQSPTDPRPTDPPFLFTVLLAAWKSGDSMLESLARDWLAEIGIHVVFGDELSTADRLPTPNTTETKGGRTDE
jgi:hypothetical protein